MGVRASRKPTSISRQGRGRAAAGCDSTGSQAARLYDRSLAYLDGEGVPVDLERSFALNAEAARLGDHDAVLAMGWYYNHRVGVAADEEESRSWYRRSASRGEARAMFSLGASHFLDGQFEAAIPWFLRAAKAGHVRSLYWLGKASWRGSGVPRDRKQAMRRFQQAAAQNVEEAKRFLRLLAHLSRRSKKDSTGRR